MINNTVIYDNIIPIGDSCHAAMTLNDVKLRQKSYPFDWVRIRIPKIISVLEENFTGWVNNGELTNKYNIHQGHHSNYTQNERKIMWTRRYTRMLDDLKNSKNIIIFSLQHWPLTNNELDNLYNFLVNKYNNLNIRIINFTRLVKNESDLNYKYKTTNKNIENYNILCDNDDDKHLKELSVIKLKSLNIKINENKNKNDIKLFQ